MRKYLKLHDTHRPLGANYDRSYSPFVTVTMVGYCVTMEIITTVLTAMRRLQVP